MVLKDILAISGEPGLFKFVAQGKNSIVVEHLETKKRISVFGSAKVSSLDEISVFTTGDDIALGKVFDNIYEKENGGATVDYKIASDQLKSYFQDVLPEYDQYRVYVSDMKKIVQWYNILHKNDFLVKEEENPEEEAEQK